MIDPIHTDRSRLLEHQRCPRARWWGYEYGRDLENGRAGGLRRAMASIPLSTGQFVHVGVTFLLEASMHLAVVSSDAVEAAIRLACNSYHAEVANRFSGFGKHEFAPPPGFDESVAEQLALTEALIRSWAIRRLPVILAEYEVVEVEREQTMTLAKLHSYEGFHTVETGQQIIWQSRADALLKRRDNGDLVVYSLKTAARWDERAEASNQHDVQGVSEAAGIEWDLQAAVDVAEEVIVIARDRLKGSLVGIVDDVMVDSLYLSYLHSRETLKSLPTMVSAVLMDFLIKGEREEDKDQPGRWVQKSHLIRGWRRDACAITTCLACQAQASTILDAITGDWKCSACGHQASEVEFNPVARWEYAWSYYWHCHAPHPMRKSKWYPAGECPGDGRKHKLGDNWESFSVWTNYPGGVSAWIADLNAGKIQPDAGDALESIHIVPMPYYRTQQDMEDWKEQAAAMEIRVAEDAARLRILEDPENRRRELNRCFPQNRRACDYPMRCQFTEICHGPVGPEKPEDSGFYNWREPHHAPELEQLQERQLEITE